MSGSPDFVYFTHHHFDHLHYPSPTVDRNTQVLIPRFGVDLMRAEMESIGFTRARDRSRRRDRSSRPTSVVSFQYGFDDTAFAVRMAGGGRRRQRLQDPGPVAPAVVDTVGADFVFKSYSFAQSYPITYTAEDPADLASSSADATSTTSSVGARVPAPLRRPLREHDRLPPSCIT